MFEIKRMNTMAKVWKDADEVIKMIHELPSDKLRSIDKEMISIPKFNKWNKKEEKYLKK
jgi:hypothetical protein